MQPNPPKPSRGRKKPPHLERQILQVAQLFFAKRGFDDVAMDDIAREANTSKTTIYAYFGNKQKLFKAALEDLLGQLPPAATLTESGAEAPFPEQLMVVANRIDQLLSSMSFDLVRRTLASDITAPMRDRIWKSTVLPYLDAIHDWLVAQASGGALKLKDPRSSASLFIALIAGGKALHSQLGGSSFGFIEEDHIHQAVELFLDAHAPAHPQHGG